jgi:hypothetical protein
MFEGIAALAAVPLNISGMAISFDLFVAATELLFGQSV